MKQKDRIDELEKRVRELEARPQYMPVYWPIYVQPQPAYVPPPQPWFGLPMFPTPQPYPVIPPCYPVTWTAYNTSGDNAPATAGGVYLSS